MHLTYNDEWKEMVKLMGSADPAMAAQAAREFALAVNEPIRRAIFDCDIARDIFVPEEMGDCGCNMYQLDIVEPGTEREYVAYAIPACASHPRHYFESDYLTVPTYRVGSCVEACEEHIQKARYNMVARLMRVYEASFTRKLNLDAWHLILAAGLDRNIVVYDPVAKTGQFTKRLLSLMKLAMKRNNGGNGGSCERQIGLTDLYVSPEAMEDILNWGLDQVSDDVRTQIFNTCDGLSVVHCVKMHSLHELGVGQEFNNYYTTDLGGTLPDASNTGGALDSTTAKEEIVVGLNLDPDVRRDSFVMPVETPLRTMPWSCPQNAIQGFRGYWEHGLAVLSSRPIILGSY